MDTTERTELVRILTVLNEWPQYFTPGISDEQIDLLEPLVDAGLVTMKEYYAEDDGNWAFLYSLNVSLASAVKLVDSL